MAAEVLSCQIDERAPDGSVARRIEIPEDIYQESKIICEKFNFNLSRLACVLFDTADIVAPISENKDKFISRLKHMIMIRRFYCRVLPCSEVFSHEEVDIPQCDGKRVFFFDLDHSLIKGFNFAASKVDSSESYDSEATENALFTGYIRSNGTRFMFFQTIPHLKKLFLYLMRQGYLLAIYSAGCEDRNRGWMGAVGAHLFGKQWYSKLKKQGHFKVFSSQHCFKGEARKNISKIVTKYYPDADIKRCIMLDDLLIKPEGNRIGYSLKMNPMKHAAAFIAGCVAEFRASNEQGSIWKICRKAKSFKRRSKTNWARFLMSGETALGLRPAVPPNNLNGSWA
ncbi:MAG: hypothetical protein ACPGXY_02710 [Alphaproteobacteria bacterium]